MRSSSQIGDDKQASDYLPIIEHALNESLAERPGLVIHNAGMAPFEGCSTPRMAGITEEILRERNGWFSVSSARGAIPIAFALAGGYVGQNLSQKGLTSLHWTIQAKVELECKLLRKYG
jgi:hypothetical protein